MSDQLLQAIAAQVEASKALQASVEVLAVQVGVLVNAVAELLGEELGTPDDQDAEPKPYATLDGEPIQFRTRR